MLLALWDIHTLCLDPICGARVSQDFCATFSLDYFPAPRIDDRGLEHCTEERVEHASQQTPDRHPQDPDHLVVHSPTSVLTFRQHPAYGAAADGAERQEKDRGECDAETSQRTGEQADKRDATIRARRDGAQRCNEFWWGF